MIGFKPASAQDFAPDYMTAVDQLKIEDLRATMLQSWTHGLNPKLYWRDDMEWAYQKDSTSRDLKNRANKAFLNLLTDVSLGSVDPGVFGPEVKFTRKKFMSSKFLQAVVNSSGNRADLVFDVIAPQNPPYESLRAGIEKVYTACANGSWIPLTPVKTPLRLNTRNKVVVDLKKRLSLLGYKVTNPDDLYDSDVMTAVNDIQWNLRWKPDGVISPGGRTWKFLAVSCKDRVRQMQADMEKMRWFPQQFEQRYIFINLAMTYFGLIDKTGEQPSAMSFRTINGREKRKSPTMQDRLVTVILNPYWIVPPTIFLEDKVEEIKKLPVWEINGYFESHNYEVWNKAFTKRLDPASIDWWSITEAADADIYIRQRPNYLNALGVIKFELTNSFSIYLHDTNQRELFVEPNRLLSSGCVRLERPLDLAEYLLKGTEWTRQVIENSVAKPGQVMKTDTRIRLTKPVAVYMAYLTSLMSSDGVIRFVDDTYGQNQKILKAIAAPF
ncbi:MAG: L,D-transpeptidase family protein [Bdellovibrio sp.]|nr:L,D-transpeptidase family protein [Bdellovibrio sp.]